MNIDLHTHSTASDGSLTPTELVTRAHGLGLSALALTDHDTVTGVPEAAAAAAAHGIDFVPGVELSSRHAGRTLHLVGLHIDVGDRGLSDLLDRVRLMRERRNPRLVERLAELGYPVTLDEVTAIAGGAVVGRPHFAEALVGRGYVTSTAEAFARFLGTGGAAHVRKERADAAECIAAVRRAGGVPILAHPTTVGLEGDALDSFVGGLAALGLAGIELYCEGHTAREQQQYSALARRYNLVGSGGSDFHGRQKPEIELGRGSGTLRVPAELLAPIAAAAEQIRKERS